MKKFLLILFLLVISCTEKTENKSIPKGKDDIELNELKKNKQKEIDSLKQVVKQLQEKRDSLKKINSK